MLVVLLGLLVDRVIIAHRFFGPEASGFGTLFFNELMLTSTLVTALITRDQGITLAKPTVKRTWH
ncbi:MAG: hypothetical protein ACI9UR_000579 [Bacteroidia bacterium]|jgi:hypothetical protein